MHPEPTNHELDLMRWLDGEMSATERQDFEQILASNPSLRAEADELQALSMGFQKEFPLVELKNADFFNHQIQRAIASEQAPAKQPEPAVSIWQWLRSPWALGAAAAALAAALLLNGTSPVSEIVGSYAPNPGIQVTSYHDSEAAATVLILEGLDAVPADKPLIGYHISHSETDPAVAQTTLFDQSGAVVAVVAQNAANEPLVIAR
jgi:hypothetical protein